MSLKILQINSVFGIGSTGRIVNDIHKLIIETNMESQIAYGRGEANTKLDKNIIRIGNQFNVLKHVIKSRVSGEHGFDSKKATHDFIERVKQINPDIIHLHNIHGYYINIEILFEYLKKSGKKIVWTLHDCWSFTGQCSHFEYIQCEKWKTECHNCPQIKEYPKTFVDNSKWNFNQKKTIFSGVPNLTIVTPSLWLKGMVEKSFLNDYPIRVINNGIDLEKFSPCDSDFKEKYNLQNKYIILGVANVWTEKKGWNFFLNLSKKIKSDEVIVLIGVSKKQLKELPQNIIGINQTNNIDELISIYSAADLFFNPTLEDTFPTTNIEALAMGLPVITFDAGGSGEIIDPTCGIKIRKSNLEESLNSIEFFKSTRYKSENSILRAKKYNKKDLFIKYIELYKE